MYGGEPVSLTGRSRTRFGEVPVFPEGLYDLGNQAYAWLVPNGAWGESNAGLVVGDGASLLLDTQWDLSFTGEMLKHMQAATHTAPTTHLVITHSDGDHAWGGGLLPDAEVTMSEACGAEIHELSPGAMTMLARVGKALEAVGRGGAKKAGIYFHNMVAPYDFKRAEAPEPNRVFAGETGLTVGDRGFQLIQAGPAHTRGDIFAFLPDAGIVFCGDIVFAECTPVMWAGPLENLITALEKILALDAHTFVPGHGPLCDRSGVLKVKEYWEFMRREIRARYEAGMSAKDAAFDIALSSDFTQSEFAGWDSPERIMTTTHVTYRHLQGRDTHLKPLDRISILWKQAQLACELPGASPAIMRGSGR